MAALTLGTDPTAPAFENASAGGDTFDNRTGRVYIWVENGTGGSVTVSFAEGRTCSFGHTAQPQTEAVADSTTVTVGPFSPLRFNDSSREVTITYSPDAPGDATLRVSAVRM